MYIRGTAVLYTIRIDTTEVNTIQVGNGTIIEEKKN